MALYGWVKIYRQIKQCWLYDDKPFDRTHAWIDLILSANHEEKKILLGNELIIVERGSFITSEVKLSAKWGWSRKKVRTFLGILESDKMLVKKSTTKYTSITIENYSVYQDIGTTKEQQKNSKGTSEEQQRNTNKNDKELIKNDKNNIIGDFTDNPLLNETINEFVKMRKLIKKPMTSNAINLMIKKLNKLANNDIDRIIILNNSIENSWQGIFELKGGVKTGTNNKKDKEASTGTCKVEYDFSKYGG